VTSFTRGHQYDTYNSKSANLKHFPQLDEGIVELAKGVPVRLEALYEGTDPFAEPEEDEAAAKRQNGNGHRSSYRRGRAYS